MRANPKVRSVQNIVDTTLVTVAETAAATVVGVSTQSSDSVVRLTGTVTVLGGTNTTGVTVTVRRGTGVTGAVVGEANTVTLTGAETRSVTYQAEDVPGEVSNQAYTVTVQLVAATANGAVRMASMAAIS